MIFALSLAETDIPLWWTIGIALVTLVAGLWTGQRAGERDWHKERRPKHTDYLAALDQLRQNGKDAIAQVDYVRRYRDVRGVVKEKYLDDQLEQIGSNPDDLIGPRAVTETTVDHFEEWLVYDMRPYLSRVLRLDRLGLSRPPAHFEIERIGAQPRGSAPQARASRAPDDDTGPAPEAP